MSLSLMAALLLFALLWPAKFLGWVNHPGYYLEAKLVHVLCVMLFFANAIIGTLWEARSLLSGNIDNIRFTYRCVTWLDSVFTAPLILVSVLSGIMLGTIQGGVWNVGWISLAFTLFLLSGLVWVLADIPSQYRINREFDALGGAASELPASLRTLLRYRVGINAMGVLPLLVILYLMVMKPELPSVASWFRSVAVRATASGASGTGHWE